MNEKSSIVVNPRVWALYVGAALCLIGVVLSVITLHDYIGWKILGDQHSSMCQVTDTIAASGEFDCRKVSSSSYGTLLGVPLGVYGSIFFSVLILLVAVFRILEARIILSVLQVLGLMSVAGCFVLAGLSHFIIGALCSICVGIYVVSFLTCCAWWISARTGLSYYPIKEGFSALVVAPIIFFRITGRVMIVWSLFVLSTALVIIASVELLPRLIEEHYLNIQTMSSKVASTTITNLFSQWEGASEDIIPINEEPGSFIDYSKGPVNAPIKIVEFSDFECPACRYAFNLIENLIERYPDQIRVTYKNYPLDKSCNPLLSFDLHYNACVAAAYARCVGESGKFWDATQQLFSLRVFEEQKSIDEVRTSIFAGAKALGLDPDKIEVCSNRSDVIAKIHQDISEGLRLGVDGTPAIWINGKRLPVLKVELVNRIVESLLRRPRV